MKKFFTKVKEVIFALIAAVAKFWKECSEAEASVAACRAKQYQAMQKQQLHYDLRIDYNLVANGVAYCIKSIYGLCGLAEPQVIEDVLCSDENDSITRIGQVTVFRFEVKRFYGGTNIHQISKGLFSKVPVSDIENELRIELPKFMRCRGYLFSNLKVDDIGHGRVRIALYGVDRF